MGFNGAELNLRSRIYFAIGLAALTAMGGCAYGAERVMLSNGFAMDCNHHAQVEGRVRVYLSSGESSYIEMRPEEVAGFEQVPDLAPQAVSTEVGRSETKLSSADLHEMLSEAGQAHNLDEDLLASVVKAESNGNARAVSRSGARGLMQL
ncbi:transglycosylase SLT domain-containing protein, partial [Bradyrhizobium sp.]|uniref:transglycosylase SLT domain-containing protein n=1 Tax=Bradyrhizobium sp. TaxID=376 RepID=UPI003C401EDB